MKGRFHYPRSSLFDRFDERVGMYWKFSVFVENFPDYPGSNNMSNAPTVITLSSPLPSLRLISSKYSGPELSVCTYFLRLSTHISTDERQIRPRYA